MHATAIRVMASGILLVSGLVLISCSGSSGPEPGTPAFYWSAAQETFGNEDYVKTIEHLENVTATNNDYTARARPWLLVVASGMVRGYMDLADNFEAGGRANKADPTDFRRHTNTYREQADRLAVEFAEAFAKFQQGKDDPVLIAYPFPTGSAAPVVQLTKASTGMMLAPGELEPAEKRAITRGVLLQACAAVGAPDDVARAQELLKAGAVKVPRAAFVTLMANTLYDESKLYGVREIDKPDRVKIFCTRALDALKTVPETKETKNLSGKIAKSLKAT